jgi:hypothetical protein
MTAENELPLDEAANEELQDEELQDEELDELAAGILCAPPEQIILEPKRIF